MILFGGLFFRRNMHVAGTKVFEKPRISKIMLASQANKIFSI